MIATEPISPPIEVVTPIKPSEAIRLGCLTTRQQFAMWGDGGLACANRAMAIGFGWDSSDEELAYRRIDARARLPKPTCCTAGPECDLDGEGWLGEHRFASTVIHLNDDHRWSRERIADWLEGLGL